LAAPTPMRTMAWLLALSLQPWVMVLHESIFSSAGLRAFMLICQEFGTMMLIAFFFQASGSTLSTDSDDTCDQEGPWAHFVRTLAYGLVSCLLSALPAYLIFKINMRGFMVVGSKEEMQRRLKRWFFQDLAIWICGAAFIIFCTLFVATFLANVSARDSGRWSISVCITLVEYNLLLPLLFGAIGALLMRAAEGREESACRRYLQERRRWKLQAVVVGEAEVPLSPVGSSQSVQELRAAARGLGVDDVAQFKLPLSEKDVALNDSRGSLPGEPQRD